MKSDLIDAFYVSVKYALSTKAEVNRTWYSFSLWLLFAVPNQLCSTQLCLSHKFNYA